MDVSASAYHDSVKDSPANGTSASIFRPVNCV
jgi:hypothetical protein